MFRILKTTRNDPKMKPKSLIKGFIGDINSLEESNKNL